MSRIWIWLWTVTDCEGGDLAAIAAKAKAHNVGVMVKTHDGATSAPNGNLGFRLIEELRVADVPVRSWGYCYPGVSADLQASFAAQAGVDYVADVEVEYDGHRAEAAALVDALRAKLPGRLVGYAPLPIVSYHDGAGQYEEFNRLDVACPQAYAGTGGLDAIGALHWTQSEWERAFARCNIEPAVYAADQPADGLRHALAIVTGMTRSFGNGDVSIWSWQHMTDAHWAVVDEFAQEEDMDPDKLLALLNDPAFIEKVDTVRAIKKVLADEADAIRNLSASGSHISDPELGVIITKIGVGLEKIGADVATPKP